MAIHKIRKKMVREPMIMDAVTDFIIERLKKLVICSRVFSSNMLLTA